MHNIVLTDKIELEMSLESLVASLNNPRISYEPEQFPALFYKDEKGISYTLFSSGKIVITGVTDVDLARRNLEKFKTLIAG